VTFSNGDYVAYSDFYFNGMLMVSPPFDLAEYQKYKAMHFEMKKKPATLIYAPHTSGLGFNRDDPYRVASTVYRDGRVYQVDIGMVKGASQENRATDEARRDSFAKNLVTRKTFEIPGPNDVCIPFAYIKDDGKKFRMVGVAMRLLDHPDVEIFFKDMDARNQEPTVASQFRGSRGQVEYFWSYYGPTLGTKLDGVLDHYHHIKLGDYTGQYAFASIARPIPGNDGYEERDETDSQRKSRVTKEMNEGKVPVDYGFMAYYQGDETKANEPNLMLYVIRTASRAVAAGKQPVTEAELKTMAMQIAASIKRRGAD
jgi:hypothetical protein